MRFLRSMVCADSDPAPHHGTKNRNHPRDHFFRQAREACGTVAHAKNLAVSPTRWLPKHRRKRLGYSWRPAGRSVTFLTAILPNGSEVVVTGCALKRNLQINSGEAAPNLMPGVWLLFDCLFWRRPRRSRVERAAAGAD